MNSDDQSVYCNAGEWNIHRLLLEQLSRGGTILDVLHFHGVQLDPRPHNVVYLCACGRRFEGPGACMGPGDLEPFMQEGGTKLRDE